MTGQTPSDAEHRGQLVELLREEGARLGSGEGGAAVARTFGDVESEYRALTETAAVVDDTDRTLVRVTEGRKAGRAHETLAGLLTNHFEDLPAGRALYSFLLTAKGSPVADLRAIRREGEDWLDLPSMCREGVLGHFEKYLPPLLASYGVDESLGRLGVVGPRADEAVVAATSGLGGAEPAPLEGMTARIGGGETFVLRRGEEEPPGYDLYVPADRAADSWRKLRAAVGDVGGRPAGREAREIRRVELGIPAYGSDIDEGTLPHETGQIGRAVSFEKGCYTGQEVVVRIEHRGQVNRHLRGLAFEDGLPDPGAELYAGERSRGTVTTPVRSPRLGPIGLGYVRREVDVGSRLALEPEGEPVCLVRELPFEA